MVDSKPARRPVTQTRTGPPEKTVEGARTREPVEDESAEQDSRPSPRIRQIHGGEVHWFTGGKLARETR